MMRNDRYLMGGDTGERRSGRGSYCPRLERGPERKAGRPNVLFSFPNSNIWRTKAEVRKVPILLQGVENRATPENLAEA